MAMGARCRTDEGGRVYAAVLNLSPDGCCLMLDDADLQKGQRVQLWPDGLSQLTAQVQWTKGQMAGLRFDAPLYGPVFEHFTQMYKRTDPEGAPKLSTEAGELPPVVREELREKIRRRQAADVPQKSDVDPLYRKISVWGTRPGLATRKTDENLIQLLLT